MPSLTRSFFENTKRAEMLSKITRSLKCNVANLADLSQRNYRLAIEALQQDECSTGGSSQVHRLSSMLLSKLNNFTGGGGGLFRDFRDAPQKEFQPLFPLARIAHRLKPVIVLRPVLL